MAAAESCLAAIRPEGAGHMTPRRYPPSRVIPRPLGHAVDELPYWFVIGGQAVRCFCPYRPSRDVDFGVSEPRHIEDLLVQLEKSGKVTITERAPDTLHLLWNGIPVSIFVLEMLTPFVEDRSLTITGILATKVHAILDRGARRDFFDLYVILQDKRLGLSHCLAALRSVYRRPIDDTLILRALTYFDDAEREAPLPREGDQDFTTVKSWFQTHAGHLLVPPGKPLAIQSNEVDVAVEPPPEQG